MKNKKKKNIKNKNRLSKRDLPIKRKKKYSWLKLVVLLGIVLAITLLFTTPYFQKNSQKQKSNKTEIEFKKEGQLSFFDKQNNQLITTIDIEIAEDDYEIALGLMYRYSMADSLGMLFIMEKEEPKLFWMKDTYISLDIIYLNKDFKIVKIHKYTQPLSEQSIPSIEKSKYVIEVNGGFCDKLKIEEGDIIKYKKSAEYNKS